MEAMPLAEDLKKIVNNTVSSYEASIQNIGTLFDISHQILQDFHDPIFDTRQEREKLNAELRESLARNESLRRKDFDSMMQGIISAQNEREREVRKLLDRYLIEQKETVGSLRKNLKKFKNSLAKGEAKRVKEFREMIKEILAEQNQRKEEVTFRLKEFKNEQKVLESRLKELLAKGKELRIRDFKSMLKEFKARFKERLARQEERKKEVRQLLDEFKRGKIK